MISNNFQDAFPNKVFAVIVDTDMEMEEDEDSTYNYHFYDSLKEAVSTNVGPVEVWEFTPKRLGLFKTATIVEQLVEVAEQKFKKKA